MPQEVHHTEIAWWKWFFVGPVAVAGALFAVVIFIIPVSVLALLSIPYYAVFPERHMQRYDFDGNPHEQDRLAEWRRRYSRLSMRQRIDRALAKRQRRRNA